MLWSSNHSYANNGLILSDLRVCLSYCILSLVADIPRHVLAIQSHYTHVDPRRSSCNCNKTFCEENTSPELFFTLPGRVAAPPLLAGRQRGVQAVRLPAGLRLLPLLHGPHRRQPRPLHRHPLPAEGQLKVRAEGKLYARRCVGRLRALFPAAGKSRYKGQVLERSEFVVLLLLK